MRAALASLGIDATPRSWSIQPARCHFDSDYPDESEWEDRWPDMWIVRVAVDGQVPPTFDELDLPTQVEETDGSWEYDFVDPGHDRVALLQFDWRGVEAPGGSVYARLEPLRAELGDLSVEEERAGEGWTRMRVVATGDLFPERVRMLEAFLEQCRTAGLIVHRWGLDE
ncbi:MAG TPA: hypothetical protein VIL20_07725 [Sandaracinaceae bacterium]